MFRFLIVGFLIVSSTSFMNVFDIFFTFHYKKRANPLPTSVG